MELLPSWQKTRSSSHSVISSRHRGAKTPSACRPPRRAASTLDKEAQTKWSTVEKAGNSCRLVSEMSSACRMVKELP